MGSGTILQIVSGFKPSVDGMGDFARLLGKKLANHLSDQQSLRSHFVVYRQPLSAPDLAEIAPDTLSYPPRSDPSALSEHLDQLVIQQTFDFALVHYGPYGYSREGKPAAFAAAIERLSQQLRVLVFFHETVANGKPWQRAFWTHAEQKQAVQHLLKLSSAAFTSNAKYMARLEHLNSAHRAVTKIPIFSNVGEPDQLLPLAQRAAQNGRQLVLFGQLATRNRLYRERLKTLEAVCRKLQIESVVDVGAGQSPFMPSMLGGATVRSAGWMDEHQLSALMARSIAGILGYWPDVWEKSGVLAAYSAHALVPVLVELEPRRLPKPVVVPYVLPEEVSNLGENESSLQSIADAAHAYYLQYQAVGRCAEVISAFATHR